MRVGLLEGRPRQQNVHGWRVSAHSSDGILLNAASDTLAWWAELWGDRAASVAEVTVIVDRAKKRGSGFLLAPLVLPRLDPLEKRLGAIDRIESTSHCTVLTAFAASIASQIGRSVTS